ncbi:apolipoprotein D-like [Palaemon carinicauda]|uniref:apolipoprotein D-like n=1 Tax=Palaemon carinicauda TaxID=392227 RepID=UPI0035B694D9
MQPATMRVTAALVLFVAAGLQQTDAHKMGIGQCKKPTAQENFQPNQFTGLWYVIEIFSTTSKCMTMTFNRTDTGFKVTEAREFMVGRMVNVDHTFKNTGTFTINDPTTPAIMKANWPSNFLSDADVRIVDTDYTKYAVLFECQFLYFMNRHSAVILSRESTLDSETIEKIKSDLATFGINVSAFDIIDHRNCNKPGEADFNWGIDEDTFKFINPENSEPSSPVANPADIEIIESDATENEVF